MEEKIIMTSPYPQMTQEIADVSKELNIPVKIVEGFMKEAALLVKNTLEKKPSIEVIISRAGTFEEISNQNISCPIIHCDNSDFDILEAFWNAKKIGDKIGFLTYQDERYPYKISKLNEILGTDIHLYPYQSWEDLVEKIEKSYHDHIDVIVGGGRAAMKLIHDYGMKGMHISTSRRTITRAILRAQDIVNYRIQAREKAEQLNSILNITGEAIIVTDKLGNITYFNPSAESILGIDAKQVIGLSNEEILSIDTLYQIINSPCKQVIKIFDKPFIIESIDIEIESNMFGKVYTIKEVKKIQQLENKIRQELYQKGLVAKHELDNILCNNFKMKQLIMKAKKYSERDSTILITGESGTGKELFAQGIHLASLRKDGPFVAVNCAAISDSLLQSELFGYDDGAFTGARKGGKPGMFELAHGGTIFLDEIGEISTEIQAILLRVIQEKEIMRVGGDRLTPIDVRVIAATNRNLWESVQNGTFREDLFFRLNVLRLQLPPLRERKDDISLLVNNMLRHHKVTFFTWEQFPSELKYFFLEYKWPGNVRHLENVVERLVLNMDTLTDPNDLIREILYEYDIRSSAFEKITNTASPNKESMIVSIGNMEEMEVQILEQMLKMYEDNRSLVADKLGISRTTLWKKLKSNSS